MIFVITLSDFQVKPQSGSGLFLTANDYAIKKLSHQSKRSRVRTHDLFKKDIIQIVCKEGKFTYKKDSVYGYRSMDGTDYRIVNGKYYTILNPEETILIYKRQESPGIKAQAPTYKYYFSKDFNSPLYILNLNNLFEVFVSYKKFLKILEMYFGDHSSLIEYDSVHGMYKINRLLKISEE